METFRHRGKGGYTYSLHESDHMFILRTKGQWDPKDYIKEKCGYYFSDISEVDNFPEASVFVYHIKGNSSIDLITKIKQKIKSLEDDRVVFIGSVFENKYGNYQIYTGNIFLKFEKFVSNNQQLEILNQLNIKVKRKLNFIEGAYFLEPEGNIGRGIFDFCLDLLKRSDVELCHPEIVVKRKSVDFDVEPDYPIRNDPWVADMIDLKEAWKSTRGANVKICIIDDGIDVRHKAFSSKEKMVKSIDMFGDKHVDASHKFPSEMHGTCCASVASSNDPLAMGVAPESKLMVVRSKGLGSVLEAEAIRWAADEGADIISCSWGPSDGSITNPHDDFINHLLPDHTRLALEYAAKKGRNGKGCLIFFAAGNGREPVVNDGYASNKYVMAIGSVNKNRQPSLYSDTGAPLFGCFPSSEIIIRGEKISQIYGLLTADRIGTDGYSPTDYFSVFGGTSASCPGMAGAAALMLSINPDLQLEEAKELLKKSCIHPHGKNGNDYDAYGNGIINCLQLVNNTKNFISINTHPMKSRSNSNVRALHIALNEVNPAKYNGEKLELAGCLNDAAFYSSLSTKFLQNTVITNDQATRVNVIREIERLVQISQSGDHVFITYAGHGSLVDDISGDEADNNKKDETLVLYDGLLIDDEINNLLAKFEAGVNIVWISDSCHSGSNTRMVDIIMPEEKNIRPRYVSQEVAQTLFDSNREYYLEELNKLPQNTRGDKNGQINVKANLITLAAVGDNQLAADGEKNGLFTATLIELYSEYNNTISYETIIEEAQKRLRLWRQPVLSTRGTGSIDLKKAIFFQPHDKMNQNGNINEPIEDTSNIKTNDSNVSKEENATVFFEEGIIIGGNIEDQIEMEQNASSSRGSQISILKISEKTVSPLSLPGRSQWDKAYQLYDALSSDVRLEYIEPDLVSATNADPESEQNRSGDFISTYPNPVFRKHPQPLIWHLDDDHSQLKSAFRIATKKEERQGGLNDTNRDTFPLIAHIDTGILRHHKTRPLNYREDLSSRFANPIDKDRIFGFLTAEQQGHGNATVTILAGGKLTKAESGSDFKGYLGAFPYARVATLRISDTVVLLSGKKFAEAVYYAVDELKADVITMSMAGAPSMRMLEAINYAYEKGVVIISAAGNNWSKGIKKHLPETVMYPAKFSRVIGVTGATYDDTPYVAKYNEDWKTRAEGGEYMQTCYGPREVMDSIIAAYTPNIVWANKKNEHGIFVKSGGGTSSATPQVAAAAALWIHHHRDKLDKIPANRKWQKVEAVRNALFQSAKKVYPDIFGNGIIQAKDALDITPDKKFIDNLKKTPPDSLSKPWLKSIVDMFDNRSIQKDMFENRDLQKINDRLIAMLSTEIEQLILTQKELSEFQSKTDNLLDLKIALLKNEKASDFLKQILSLDRDVVSVSAKQFDARSTGLPYYSRVFNLESDKRKRDEHIIISSKDMPVNAEFSIDKTPGNLIGSITIDVENSRSTGARYGIKLPKNDQLAYLICHEDETGKMHCTWQYPPLEQTISLNRNITSYSNQWEFELQIGGSRGWFENIKNVIINVFRVVNDESSASLQGLISRDYNSNKNSWTKIDNKTLSEIQKQEKTILLLHGLFSSTENAFDSLLDNQHFIKSIQKKGYGRNILGYNMRTIRTGIVANAADLRQTLEDNKINPSKCIVIAHSRGCLVAREAFDLQKTPMILNAGPHLGTPMANIDGILSLVDTISNMTMATLGKSSPILSVLPTVLKLLGMPGLHLDGITDMAEGSEFISNLNEHKILTNKQTLIGTNYNPCGLTLFADAAVDEVIFQSRDNDLVVPLDSSLSKGVGVANRIEAFGNSHTHHFDYFCDPEIVDELIAFL